MITKTPEVNHSWQESRATVLRQGLPHARATWRVRWARSWPLPTRMLEVPGGLGRPPSLSSPALKSEKGDGPEQLEGMSRMRASGSPGTPG